MERQDQRKNRPLFIRPFFRNDLSPVHARDILDQIQAESTAPGREAVRSFCLVKFPENLFSLRFFNADAVVFEPDAQPSVFLQKADIYSGFFAVIVFDGVVQDIHHQHFKEGRIDAAKKGLSGRIVNPNVAIAENMAIVLMELLNGFYQIGRDKVPAVGLRLDSGQVQDTADKIGRAHV
jgi:hypothetical protein